MLPATHTLAPSLCQWASLPGKGQRWACPMRHSCAASSPVMLGSTSQQLAALTVLLAQTQLIEDGGHKPQPAVGTEMTCTCAWQSQGMRLEGPICCACVAAHPPIPQAVSAQHCYTSCKPRQHVQCMPGAPPFPGVADIMLLQHKRASLSPTSLKFLSSPSPRHPYHMCNQLLPPASHHLLLGVEMQNNGGGG